MVNKYEQFKKNFYDNNVVTKLTRPRELLNKIFFFIGFLFFVGCLYVGSEWKWWLISFAMYVVVVGLGVSLTFHRYLAHRSFEMHRLWVILFSILSGVTGTGSTFGWVTVHRTHHTYPDSDKDPHSPHVLNRLNLFFGNYRINFNKWIARDLLKDKFHMRFHNYYLIWVLLWTGFLAICGPKYLAHMWAIPLFFNKIQAFCSVWLSHEYGYRNYETKDESRQNWLVSLLVFGEGWHNNHHYSPKKWNFSLYWWEVDPGALLVKIFRSS